MSADRAAEVPWLGLLSYTSEDRELFFGRSRETEALLRMIRREPLTTVFGPSGTGKTSLLNAAIAPALAKEDFLPVYIRLDHNPGSASPGRQIRARIEKEIQNRGLDPSSFAPAEPEESVWEYLHRVELWDRDNNPITPVLFFDQFEEAFTIGAGRPETTSFFTDLADLVENYTPASVRDRLAAGGSGLPYPQMRRYKIVLSLREDFVHKLDGLRKLMPSIMQNRFPLTRMTPDQAMDAVLKPGAGLVTEDVAREIVNFVAGAPSSSDGDVEVEPALLSVVCRELNFRRIEEGTPVITSEQVASSSADVLRDFYERSFEGVPIEARYFVEDRLLTASGFRSTAPEEDAFKAGIPADVIRLLEDRRIIRREQRLKIPHVELTHDLLTRVVRDSRDARHERLRLEQERLEHSAREAKLLREREEQQARLKAARRLTVVMTAAAILCLVFVGIAFVASRNAKKALQDARINLARFYEERAGSAEAVGANLEAWMYTLEALSTVKDRNSPIQVSAGRLLLPEVRPGRDEAGSLYWDAAGVRSLAFTPDGGSILDGRVAGGDTEDLVHRWGAESITWTTSTRSTAQQVAVSPDGKTFATASSITADDKDGALDLWTTDGSILCTRAHPRKPDSTKAVSVDGVAFSPVGKIVASSGSNGSIQLWSVNPNAKDPCVAIGQPMTNADSDRVQRIAFSANGRILAAAAGKKIVFWDTRQPESPKLLNGAPANRRPVQSLVFNTDARVPEALAVGYEDEGLCWWTLGKASAAPTCPAKHVGPTWSVSISPDRKLVASGHTDQNFRIWDFATGRLIAEIREDSPVTSVAFNPRGDAVAYGTGSGIVRRLTFNALFWDARSNLAELIRDPWSEQSRAVLSLWKTKSDQTLGYRFVATNLEEVDADVIAKARRRFFGNDEGSETNRTRVLELTIDNLDLFGNPANKKVNFPRWSPDGELLMVSEDAPHTAAAAFLKEDVSPPYIIEFEYAIANRGGAWAADAIDLPADGMSVMFLKDAAAYAHREPPDGGSRGVIPGSGYAIHFQLYPDRGIYIANGSDPSEVTPVPPSLLYGLPDVYTDGAWRAVRISVAEDSVEVNYAGFDVLKWEGTLDTRFNGIGFGAANGDLTADHRIRNVKVTIPRDR